MRAGIECTMQCPVHTPEQCALERRKFSDDEKGNVPYWCPALVKARQFAPLILVTSCLDCPMFSEPGGRPFCQAAKIDVNEMSPAPRSCPLRVTAIAVELEERK